MLFKIELLSLKNSSGFYEKIGGDKVIDSKNIFIFDLTSSLPEKFFTFDRTIFIKNFKYIPFRLLYNRFFYIIIRNKIN